MTAISKAKKPVRHTTSETRKIKKLEKKVEGLVAYCTELESELKAVRSKHRAKTKVLRSELKESEADCEELQRSLKLVREELEQSKRSHDEKDRVIDQYRKKLGDPKGPSLPSPHGKFVEEMREEGKVHVRKVRG